MDYCYFHGCAFVDEVTDEYAPVCLNCGRRDPQAARRLADLEEYGPEGRPASKYAWNPDDPENEPPF